MGANLSVESMVVKSSTLSEEGNELPDFDFNPPETEKEYLERNLSGEVGLITNVLS